MITTETRTITTAQCDAPGCTTPPQHTPVALGFEDALRNEGWYVAGSLCYCPPHTIAMRAAGKIPDGGGV